MNTATTLPWWSLLVILAGLALGMAALVRWLGRIGRAEAAARRAAVDATLGRLGWTPAGRAELRWCEGGLLPLSGSRTVLAVNGPRVVYDSSQRGDAVAGCNAQRSEGAGSGRRMWLRHTVVACAGQVGALGWVPPRSPLDPRDGGRQGFFLVPQLEARMQEALSAVSTSGGVAGGLVDVARSLAPAALREGRSAHALKRQPAHLADRVQLGARPNREPFAFYALMTAELLRDLLDDEPGLIVECAPGGVLVSKRVDRRPGEAPADAPDLEHGLLSPAELERFVAVADEVFRRLKVDTVVEAAGS